MGEVRRLHRNGKVGYYELDTGVKSGAKDGSTIKIRFRKKLKKSERR